MDLKEEDILGRDILTHWYYRSKAKALLQYIEPSNCRSILDVGAGSGFFTKFLLKHTEASSGVCIDISYSEEWDQTIEGKTIRYRKSCGQTDCDIVLLMDVLEHVDDDVGLMAEYIAKVPSGTQFMITVPAFSFLWSNHDLFLDHRRRYTISSLKKVINHAGLHMISISYYFGFVFPLAAAIRLPQKVLKGDKLEPKSNLKKHSLVTNSVLSALCTIELPFLRINRLAGLSVFCLCRKK